LTDDTPTANTPTNPTNPTDPPDPPSALVLPCPFCGAPAAIQEGHYGTSARWQVYCPFCGATNPPPRTKEDMDALYGGPEPAIEAWNRRAGEARRVTW